MTSPRPTRTASPCSTTRVSPRPRSRRSPSKSSRWDPPRRRSPSSSSGPTAAASSTSTRRTLSKIPRRCRTSSRLLAILLIPAALCYTFGAMVGDTRQGWTVLAAMTVMFVGLLAVCYVAEQQRRGLSPSRASTTRRAPCSRAATWRAKRCATASPARRSGRRRPRWRPTARSTPCTTPSHRSAGSCRCGRSSSARSSTAAWAPDSTAC